MKLRLLICHQNKHTHGIAVSAAVVAAATILEIIGVCSE